MPKQANDGLSNVYRLTSARQKLPVNVDELNDAVQSFDQVERCAVKLQRGPLGIAGQADAAERPIVSLQLELPRIEYWLDKFEALSVATCSDTAWVISLGDARTAARARLRTVRRSLRTYLPGIGPLDRRLIADVQELAVALRQLRTLIVQQRRAALRRFERNRGRRDIRQ